METTIEKTELKRPTRNSYLILSIFLVCLKLALVCTQPVTAIIQAKHDDALYLKLANQITQGHWLGEYDNLTLAKGAGYPLFIAGMAILHIPVPLAQHLLYIAAAACLVWALRPVLPGRGWAFFYLRRPAPQPDVL